MTVISRGRLLVVAAASALFLCAGNGFAADGGPRVEHAWARATPGQAKTGAAYFTVDGGSAADRLVAVATPVAGKAELHMHQHEDGIMKMRPVEALDIPAGQQVTLKPGGYHVMLMELKQPLKVGESFPLTLRFEKAGTRETTVTVEKVGAAGPKQHGEHGSMMMDHGMNQGAAAAAKPHS